MFPPAPGRLLDLIRYRNPEIEPRALLLSLRALYREHTSAKVSLAGSDAQTK